MTSKSLVIAKYKEDLSWLKNVNFDKKDIFIYNKSEEKSSEYKNLNNVGREPHTYLHHIICNYNNLTDLVIFTQGNPFDHSINFLNIIDKNSLDDMEKESKKVYNSLRHKNFLGLGMRLPTVWLCSFKNNIDPFLGFNSCIAQDLYVKFNLKINIESTQGAVFVVTKEEILSKSLSFYLDLYDYIFEYSDKLYHSKDMSKFEGVHTNWWTSFYKNNIQICYWVVAVVFEGAWSSIFDSV